MDELTVGQVIDILTKMKDTGKRFNRLRPEEINAINAACNVLESNYCLDRKASEIVKWGHWR